MWDLIHNIAAHVLVVGMLIYLIVLGAKVGSMAGSR